MKTKKRKWLWWLIGIIAVVVLTVGIALLAGGINGIRAVGDFITDQILGMKWLNALIGMAFTAMFGATFMSGHWGQAIQFFVYDTIKIVVLLCVLIYLISYIQSYFPPERTKKYLVILRVSEQMRSGHCLVRLHHSALARLFLFLWALLVQGFPAVLRSVS